MIWRQYTHILGQRLSEMAIVNIYTPFLSQGDSKSGSRNVPSTDILHTQPLGALSDHRRLKHVSYFTFLGKRSISNPVSNTSACVCNLCV